MGRFIDKTDLDSILKQYSFYNNKIDHFYNLPQKLTNFNSYIEIENQAWVVKRYQKNQVTQRLKLSHQIQSILFQDGFPCAKLENSRTGATFVEFNGFLYSIHRWIN